MKILITGAGGFLGKYFARHLDHDTHALDRSTLDLTNSDQVKSQLKSEQYDVVIHCASAGRNTAKSLDPAIVQNNLSAFSNLVSCRHDFGMLINFATGAEFDIDSNIDNVNENEIWNRNPLHSYGHSKNIIARQVQMLPNFYNLRIFGCFDPSESDPRPIKRCQGLVSQGLPFLIEDRPFDTVSAGDFARVVLAVLDGKIRDNDLNVVYNKKHTLGETLKIYCRLHNYDPDLIRISDKPGRSYTGDGSRLHAHALPLLGLEQSLREYL